MTLGTPLIVSTTPIRRKPITNCGLLTLPVRSTPMTIAVSKAKSHSERLIITPNSTPERAKGNQARLGLSSSSSKSSPIFRVRPADQYMRK